MVDLPRAVVTGLDLTRYIARQFVRQCSKAPERRRGGKFLGTVINTDRPSRRHSTGNGVFTHWPTMTRCSVHRRPNPHRWFGRTVSNPSITRTRGWARRPAPMAGGAGAGGGGPDRRGDRDHRAGRRRPACRRGAGDRLGRGRGGRRRGRSTKWSTVSCAGPGTGAAGAGNPLLPLGTANVLAYELGIPVMPEQAASGRRARPEPGDRCRGSAKAGTT